MNKLLTLFIALALSATLELGAQVTVSTDEIELTEMEDGQLYIFEAGDETKPLNGKVHILSADKTIRTETTLEQGFPNGKFYIYYDDKIHEESIYMNGYMTGLSKIYYENGKLESESNYGNGVMNGPFKEYDEEGRLTLEATMINGKLSGMARRFNEKGENTIVMHYKDNELDGDMLVKEITGKENTITKVHYEGGIRQGGHTTVFENGVVMIKGQYQDGKEDGSWEYRNKLNDITKVQRYKAGVLIAEQRLKKKTPTTAPPAVPK